MRTSNSLPATFCKLSALFITIFVLTAALGRGLLVPALGWFFNGVWLWEPFDSWLRFVVLAAIGGVLTGALFTNYQWLVHTSSSLTRKVVTTALVVAIYITLLVVLREWIGKMLPG